MRRLILMLGALMATLYVRTLTIHIPERPPALRAPSGKVVQWVLLVHLTGREDRRAAITETWFRDLPPSARIVTFGESADVPTLGRGQYADTRAALAYALSAYPNARRFTKADDDTYVYVSNMHARVLQGEEEYAGYPLRYADGLVFASGGASYTLSRRAAAELVSECPTSLDASEDVAVGRCMRDVIGVPLTDWVGLHPHDPWHMLRWDIRGHSPDHVRAGEEPLAGYVRPLTYHYVDPDMMRRMHAPEIPTRLHQIWIGSRPRPSRAMDECARVNQNWTYSLWTEETMRTGLPHGELVNQGRYDAEKRGDWPLKADIARYEILMHFGGVYIDADSVCLRPLDEFLTRQTNGFAVYESETRRANVSGLALLANGVLGFRPYAPMTLLLVRELEKTNWREPAWVATGPLYLTRLDRDLGLNMTKLPSRLFYPYHFEDERPANGSDQIKVWGAYTDQLWGSTVKNVYTKMLLL